MVFLLNRNCLKSFYSLTLYGFVEPIKKKLSKVLDYDEFCTNEGISKKNCGKYNKFKLIKIK